MKPIRSEVRLAHWKLPGRLALRCAERGAQVRGTVLFQPRETLLFLHGYSDHWLSAGPILPRLPADWRVLAPDQRGHGGSERPEAGYDIATLAADAAALLKAAGAPRATVVGHSMGSLVAQRLALDHPERVERLVLVGGTCAAGPAVRELAEQLRGFGEEVPREFVAAFQEGTSRRPLSPAFLEAIVAESCRMPARVWRALMEGIAAFDSRAELARISAPTRIVWGDADPHFGRADQEALHAGIPGAELSIYEGTGHNPHWEEPARFARELVDFVAKTRQPRG